MLPPPSPCPALHADDGSRSETPPGKMPAGKMPANEWAVLGPDGAELFRCPSLEQADRALSRLQPLLNTAAVHSLRLAQVAREPGSPDPGHADAQDCAWLLRQLGHVTIFAFSREDSDAAFMVMGRSGQRFERPTLIAALCALLRHSRALPRLPKMADSHRTPCIDDET